MSQVGLPEITCQPLSRRLLSPCKRTLVSGDEDELILEIFVSPQPNCISKLAEHSPPSSLSLTSIFGLEGVQASRTRRPGLVASSFAHSLTRSLVIPIQQRLAFCCIDASQSSPVAAQRHPLSAGGVCGVARVPIKIGLNEMTNEVFQFGVRATPFQTGTVLQNKLLNFQTK